MMKSWEKQILGHVNRIVDIRMGETIFHNILVVNIDLEGKSIIGRKYSGEGQFITFFNVDNVVIIDHENRRPGKVEWEKVAEEVLYAY